MRFLFLFLTVVSCSFADIKSTTGEIRFYPRTDEPFHSKLTSQDLSIAQADPSANLHVQGDAQFESGNVYLGNTYQNSQMEFAGSFGQSFASISSDMLLSINDNTSLYLVDTSSDNLNITLPYAGNVKGRLYEFKKTSALNHFRLWSSESIEGYEADLEVSAPTQGLSHLKIMSNGSQWLVLERSEDVRVVLGAGNLIGWWKLDDATGTHVTDSSGQDNHGALSGGATFSDNKVLAPTGQGLNFDTQNNYIDVSNMSGLSTTEITVSCWAYMTRHKNWTRFVNHEWVNNGWLLYCGSDGRPRFGIGQGGAQTNAHAPVITPLNEWVHIVGTYDGNDVKVYLNGSEANSSANAGATLDNVGNVDMSKSSSIDGKMDDVRIYNRALTSTEVHHLFREGL